MISLTSFLTLIHIIGLALAVGAATVKVILVFKSRNDYDFVHIFLKVSKPITQQIVFGLVLLTLSGIGWLLVGYGFTSLLIIKIGLVVAIWVLGPIIDNVVEPKLKGQVPAPGGTASPEFIRVLKQYSALEVIATSLFYIIIVIWVWA
jgi:hypothetical protein